MNDKLWELIGTLTSSEMRYFKQFAARSQQANDKNYIRLFEEIVRLKIYNETLLIERLQKKGINTKFLAADKNYLYKQILKSLQYFHTEARTSLQIKNQIAYIEILYQKGLYNQCSKIIKHCKKQAQEAELPSLLIEILHWQRKIEGITFDEQQAEALFNEVTKVANEINNYNDYNRLYYQVMLFRKQKNKLRTSEEQIKLETLISHPLLGNIELALTNMAKIRFHEIYANYYYLLEDKNNEYLSNLQIIGLLDADYMQENPFDYLAHYSRSLSLQQYAEPQKFEASLAHFKTLPNLLSSASNEFCSKVFAIASSIEMNYAIKNKNFDDSLSLIETQKEGIEQYNEKLSETFKITAYYQFSYVYLVQNDLTNALKYANKIINELHEQNRSDVYLYARVIQIIIHYELKNYKLLPYLVRSIREILEKRKKLHKAEQLMLNFLQKIGSIDNHKEWQIAIVRLRDKFVQQIAKDNFEHRFLDYFDFIAWLNSKINNISFKQAIIDEMTN